MSATISTYNNFIKSAYTNDFQSYTAGIALAGQGIWLAEAAGINVNDNAGNKRIYSISNGAKNASYISGSFNNNQWASVKIDSINTKWIGAAVRCSADNFYGLYVNSTSITIFKVIATVFTLINSVSTTINDNDIIKLSVNGSTLNALVNNSPVSGFGDISGNFTDSSLSSGNPGVCGYAFDSNFSYADNFECTAPS
jgi:hypothetical protein